jgi:23S rRNA (uracil1939-C5)-methyltransferase
MESRKTKIEKLVSGGHGLCRLDGRVVLVPYSAPGDEVLLEVAPTRRGVGWGSIRRILAPSPSRVSPFCPQYTQCGGCQLQHISYPDQLEHKRLIVEDALRRLAGLKDADVDSCIGSPAPVAYRNRVRFHCHRGKIGFHKSRSRTIVPLEHCPLLSGNINTCLKQISSVISGRHVEGLSEIQMTEGTDSRVVLMLEMDSASDAGFTGDLQENVAVSGAAVRIHHRRNLLWGEDRSAISVEGRTFRIGQGSFFQANTRLLSVLIQEVLDTVGTRDIETGVELYAGVGVFSIMLSDRVRNLVAVEWNRDAAEDALVNLKAHRIENVEVMTASAEDATDLLLSRNIRPGLVVIDPPREGLSKTVCHKLIQMSPQQLIYVSCDPATLARDIKYILASGAYRLEKIKPLDMFPHTSHIECIASLVRKQG